MFIARDAALPHDLHPDLGRELAALGFRLLGTSALCEPDAPDGYAAPDEALNQYVRGVVTEVWIDESQTVKAEPCAWIDGPIVLLTTLLRDGTVVQSVRAQHRAPVLRIDEDIREFCQRYPLGRLAWRLYPARPLWDVTTFRDELFLVEANDLTELLAIHRQKVAQHGEPIELQTLGEAVAVGHALREARLSLVDRVAWWGGQASKHGPFVLLLAACVLLLAVYPMRTPLALFVSLWFLFGGYVLYLLGMGIVFGIVAQRAVNTTLWWIGPPKISVAAKHRPIDRDNPFAS